MKLLLIVMLPLFGALLPLLVGHARNRCAGAAALAPLAALVLTLAQGRAVLTGDVLHESWPWLPQWGLDVALRLDGLALLFVLLILGIGLLIILYARYYLAAHDSLPRLYALLLVFMGAMLGVATAANLLWLLVCWEITSLASFLLIGYWAHERAARRGARMALTVTGAGGLCLLGGFLLVGQIVGSFDLVTVLAAHTALQQHPLFPCALLLILIGAFTKSAQFPFYFWLPNAMVAPTPVSAYLHSATMVKLGVFLLARLYPALAGNDWWFYGVTGTGLITLLLGAYLALFQHDLKGLLAYSTISHLGLITLLFGLSTPLAVVAAVFHIINHAIFKASLFMAAGVIDHETGTRDMRQLHGLWRYMPHTAVLAMVAAAAMAGVPLLNGFLSKEMFFSETLSLQHASALAVIVPLAAVLAGIFAVAYSLRFIHDVFFNSGTRDVSVDSVDLTDGQKIPHEPPRYMKVPIEILVVLCLLVGIMPGATIAPLLRSAAQATLGDRNLPVYSLAIWHGVNWPLLMSAMAMVGGLILYALRRPLFIYHARLPSYESAQIFEHGLRILIAWARRVLQRLEQGGLPGALAWVIGAAVGVVVTALMPLSSIAGPLRPSAVDYSASLYLAFAMFAALLAVYRHRQRLQSILSLAIVGLMSALVFSRFSAPDLALTQLVIEVVSTLLLLSALKFLPQRAAHEHTHPPKNLWRWRDGVLALSGGAIVAVLAYAVMTRPFDSISQYFIAHSVPQGGGHNVVNVILVDFRAFDTLGEITVLLIAAVAIAALLDGLRFDRALITSAEATQENRSAEVDREVWLSVVARLWLPLAVLMALYFLLRGHNAPGGGFVAGLITAAALILQTIARGGTRVRLPLAPLRLAAGGLALAALTGIVSTGFDAPFLTSAFWVMHVPLFGEIELASAMVFDLGVYGVVVGVTLFILVRLNGLKVASQPSSEHQQEVSRWNS